MQIIKTIRRTALVFGLAIALVPLTTGAAGTLLPAVKGDLQAQQISKAPAMTLANSSRDTVAFAWPVSDSAIAIVSADNPHEALSRSYRLQVSGAQLSSGVALTTTAPGALIRLHPADSRRSTMPSLQELEIAVSGQTLRGAQAMDALADAAALRSTPLGAVEGTIAFRVSSRVGAGNITLRAAKALPANGLYVINVFDQNSDVVLSARADHDSYFSGATIHTAIYFDAGVDDAKLDAFLLTPQGQRLAADVNPLGNGRFDVSGTVAYASAPGELWEVHASGSATVDGVVIPRSVKTAFAVTHASARFTGDAAIDKTDGLRIELPVAAAADGRYEARAVLYGSEPDGTLRALANVATARWIATGSADIELSVADKLIARSGLGAPFELRDLRLIDQSRMGTLHRQARALRID